MNGPTRRAAPALPFRLLERLVDGALDLDPETRGALAGLSGKVVDVEIVGAGSLRVRIDGERVRIGPRDGPGDDPADDSGDDPADDSADADVTIRGAPLSLLRFAFAGDREARILREEVSLRGDIALATRLQRIAAKLDIDFEEAFARHLGDAPAHELVRAMRGFGGWLSGTGTALLEDASEYLRHEAAITPGRAEVDRFVNDVDDLRDDAERLEARVARLERGRVDRQ